MRYPLLLFWLLLAGGMYSCHKPDSGIGAGTATVEDSKLISLKPYRVLVVIGDQWKDPMSYNIDPRRVRGGEFIDVCTMLKIWGIPFDILRLDEQRLNINRFLDGAAKPHYGCLIWMADPDKLKGYSADYQTLRRVVEDYGMSMIALSDHISHPDVASLAGIEYQGKENRLLGGEAGRLSISGGHFITRNQEGISLPDRKLEAAPSIPTDDFNTSTKIAGGPAEEEISLIRGQASESARVLGRIGDLPQVTVRDLSEETKVIWIGGGKDWYRKYPVMRKIFRESLVYAMGYGVFNDNFENGFIFIMDDIGCSEHAWSLRWHYPTPSREILEKYLIEPLEKRGLSMVLNLTPGYANPKTRMIEVPWEVEPFTDIFGNRQDYGSTKEGIQEGLRRGVFELQAHRAWSHMNWDLQSPPGPWWDGPVDGEMAVTDWYNEVVDVRRGAVPVPSNDLLFIYKTGIDAIKKAFGVTALSAEVRPAAELREGTHGGDDNGRIAAIAGLGVSRECYVGFDRTIEFSMMMPEQFTCHDLDLTGKTDAPADTTDAGWDALLYMTTEQLQGSKIAGGRRINLRDNTDWIDRQKDKYWMGFNETCAYLHAILALSGGTMTGIRFAYDDHYCKYFEKKPSKWTLELSDTMLERLGPDSRLLIDGTKTGQELKEKQEIGIPAGLGVHRMEIVPGH